MSHAIRPTCALIDRQALVSNARFLKKHAQGSDLWAVVKADAYGHGAIPCAKALASECTGFAVSLIEEAVELRQAGISQPIVVMGPSVEGGYEELLRHDILLLVSSEGQLHRLQEEAKRQDKRATVHVKVDTGMNRIGLAPAEFEELIAKRQDFTHIDFDAIATHLASADTDDPSDSACQTNKQLDLFDSLASRWGADVYRHAANTAATLRFARSLYSGIRPGLGLYGNGDTRLTPVMTLATSIAQVRVVPKGGRVSYGAIWTAAKDTKVAVLPVGYADGLPRRLSGNANAIIGGQSCPLLGTICMDMVVCDISNAASAAPGDEAILLGASGKVRISAAEWASVVGYSEYEVTCGVSKRVPRMYK